MTDGFCVPKRNSERPEGMIHAPDVNPNRTKPYLQCSASLAEKKRKKKGNGWRRIQTYDFLGKYGALLMEHIEDKYGRDMKARTMFELIQDE